MEINDAERHVLLEVGRFYEKYNSWALGDKDWQALKVRLQHQLPTLEVVHKKEWEKNRAVET